MHDVSNANAVPLVTCVLRRCVPLCGPVPCVIHCNASAMQESANDMLTYFFDLHHCTRHTTRGTRHTTHDARRTVHKNTTLVPVGGNNQEGKIDEFPIKSNGRDKVLFFATEYASFHAIVAQLRIKSKSGFQVAQPAVRLPMHRALWFCAEPDEKDAFAVSLLRLYRAWGCCPPLMLERDFL